jgi:hypothetical protein
MHILSLEFCDGLRTSELNPSFLISFCNQAEGVSFHRNIGLFCRGTVSFVSSLVLYIIIIISYSLFLLYQYLIIPSESNNEHSDIEQLLALQFHFFVRTYKKRLLLSLSHWMLFNEIDETRRSLREERAMSLEWSSGGRISGDRNRRSKVFMIRRSNYFFRFSGDQKNFFRRSKVAKVAKK